MAAHQWLPCAAGALLPPTGRVRQHCRKAGSAGVQSRKAEPVARWSHAAACRSRAGARHGRQQPRARALRDGVADGAVVRAAEGRGLAQPARVQREQRQPQRWPPPGRLDRLLHAPPARHRAEEVAPCAPGHPLGYRVCSKGGEVIRMVPAGGAWRAAQQRGCERCRRHVGRPLSWPTPAGPHAAAAPLTAQGPTLLGGASHAASPAARRPREHAVNGAGRMQCCPRAGRARARRASGCARRWPGACAAPAR